MKSTLQENRSVDSAEGLLEVREKGARKAD